MSTRATVREFLATHPGRTSAVWRQSIADRCRGTERWPDPLQIAANLGLTVETTDVEGLRFAVVGAVLYVGVHPDPYAVRLRVANAIAQHLLELSNAEWTRDDVVLLAFMLLMPPDLVRASKPAELARCPYAVPALIETWAEHSAPGPPSF